MAPSSSQIKVGHVKSESLIALVCRQEEYRPMATSHSSQAPVNNNKTTGQNNDKNTTQTSAEEISASRAFSRNPNDCSLHTTHNPFINQHQNGPIHQPKAQFLATTTRDKNSTNNATPRTSPPCTGSPRTRSEGSQRHDTTKKGNASSVRSWYEKLNKTTTQRIACKARGLPDSHNADTAYFLVPPNAKHGLLLQCSHPVCAASKRKFRFCAVCGRAASERNFIRLHGHGILRTFYRCDDSPFQTPTANKSMDREMNGGNTPPPIRNAPICMPTTPPPRLSGGPGFLPMQSPTPSMRSVVSNVAPASSPYSPRPVVASRFFPFSPPTYHHHQPTHAPLPPPPTHVALRRSAAGAYPVASRYDLENRSVNPFPYRGSPPGVNATTSGSFESDDGYNNNGTRYMPQPPPSPLQWRPRPMMVPDAPPLSVVPIPSAKSAPHGLTLANSAPPAHPPYPAARPEPFATPPYSKASIHPSRITSFGQQMQQTDQPLHLSEQEAPLHLEAQPDIDPSLLDLMIKSVLADEAQDDLSSSESIATDDDDWGRDVVVPDNYPSLSMTTMALSRPQQPKVSPHHDRPTIDDAHVRPNKERRRSLEDPPDRGKTMETTNSREDTAVVEQAPSVDQSKDVKPNFRAAGAEGKDDWTLALLGMDPTDLENVFE